MASTDPQAGELLQEYIRLEYRPDHEPAIEEKLDYGWHRVPVRPERYKNYPFSYFQYASSSTYAPFLGIPPIVGNPTDPTGNNPAEASTYKYPGGGNKVAIVGPEIAGADHGSLSGLDDNDHPQYLKLRECYVDIISLAVEYAFS